MGADEAPRAIVEHEDRWLFKPLRGRTVTRIEWKSDHLELVLDDDHFRILVGYDTELSARSLAKGSPDIESIIGTALRLRNSWGRGWFRPCSIFEIQPLDAWTGQPVNPPHWPGRPEYLKDNSDSDDIND